MTALKTALFLLSLTFLRGMATVRTIINTKNAPSAFGPYSQAVRVGDILYISGQVGVIPEKGSFAEGGVGPETHQVMKNLGGILEAANGSYNNLVKTTILLTDMNDFSTVNDIYKGYLKTPYPARATYQVAALPKGARVEIEAVAHLGEIKDE
jgi:2-iminobutanoate/2-iminopropanoate deaminase